MPTYEYGCAACGHQWEEVQRITAPATEKCPKCAQLSANRLISGGTHFILKGGGWYSDLYASSKSGSKNSDSNGGASSDSGSSEKSAASPSAETKSETKAETKPSTPPATPTTSGGS